MGTIYFECTIADNDKLDVSLGAWKVMQTLSNSFGEVSGVTAHSEKNLGGTFYLKIDAPDLNIFETGQPDTFSSNKIKQASQKLIQTEDNQKGPLSKFTLLETTPELTDIFERLEQENDPIRSETDGDLDTSTTLTEDPILTKNRQDPSPTGVADAFDSDDDDDDDSTFNPIHR